MGQLDEIAARLPQQAGVYLFKDRRGRVIYVGKAVSVRARVRQYLSGQDGRPMVPYLVDAAADVEAIVVHTEKEALLLENTLIKKHRPKFNVKLRDDSNYLHLRIDLGERWPRYRVTRHLDGGAGSRTFGPYASAQKARATLGFLQRIFPLRTCTDRVLATRRRACLLHQMGRCAAPCVGEVEPADYLAIARESVQFLDGKVSGAVRRLTGEMQAAAADERYEEAARLRDLVRAIEATVERQQVVDAKRADRDVWGLARDGLRVAIVVLPVRDGVLGEPSRQVSRGVIEGDDELLSSAINLAYPEGASIPPEVLVPTLPPDAATLAEVLSERAGRRVHVRAPERGDKVRLIEMAAENAVVWLKRQGDEATRRAEVLAELARVVGLSRPPVRIECFDNSHLGGDDPVAAMAVFLDGKPARAEYRRYRIKSAKGGDDYEGMREILARRFRRGLEDGVLPDLLVVDGGKGQLAVARAVLSDLGLADQPVVGLSKPRTEHARGERGAADKIVLPGVKDPLRLPAHHPALRLLAHLRDETHAHAVGYQRKVRHKAAFTSALEALPGVGPARRRALIDALGGLDAILAADEATLASVPGVGPSVARAIRAALDAAATRPETAGDPGADGEADPTERDADLDGPLSFDEEDDLDQP
jgi:excinuclease ABC subunit C